MTLKIDNVNSQIEVGGTPTLAVHVATKQYVDATTLILENTQSTDYTLVLSDANKIVTLTGAVPHTFTVPTNASVAYPIGTTIEFTQDGTGALTIAAGGGVTIKSEISLTLPGQYGEASIIKVGTDTWRYTGTSSLTSLDITTALGYTPVNKAGDTMTGLLILSGDPAAALGAATKQYVDAPVGTPVSGSFVKITTNTQGKVSATTAVLAADITTSLGYIPLNKAGDTMTGFLTLNADPVTALEAATKQYADKIQVSGSTLSMPTANAVIMRFASAKAFQFPSGFTGSIATSEVATTGSTIYTIKRNGATIGTITYGAASTTGTFADNTEIGTHSFAINDILTVVAPASPDATHDALAWAILGNFT